MGDVAYDTLEKGGWNCDCERKCQKFPVNVKKM